MQYKLDAKVLDKITREHPEKLSQFVRAFANDINSDIVQSFGTSIAPVGEPPGVDTGALRASMKVDQEGKFRFIVHDGVVYGVVHELALNGYPRPFVRPAFERAQRRFIEAAKAWGLLKP
jgi:hypothetical protein